MKKSTFYPYQFPTNNAGAVIVEFAVVLILFVLLCIVTTDISLAILAREQISTATRAGAEFAATMGYDKEGIKDAASKAVLGPIVPIDISNVSVSALECFCSNSGIFVDQGAAVSRSCPINASDATTFCGYYGTTPVTPLPFVTIKVIGSYSPIIPIYWKPWLNGAGAMSFSYTMTVRSF